MKDNIVLLIVVILYSFLIVTVPFQLGDGALLPFLSLLVAVGVSAMSDFNNYKSKQLFFIGVFFYLILVSHFYGTTLHSGALFSTNFRYFLILSIVPISIETIIGVFIYLSSLKWRKTTINGLSVILLGYFGLISIFMFISLLLYALSGHSV